MSRIPFIEASLADPHDDRSAIEIRLIDFLRRLRDGGETREAPVEEQTEQPERPGDLSYRTGNLTDQDHKRIRTRVARLIARREAATGLSHLKREDRDHLKVLVDGARLVEVRDEHHADELAARLHAEMPWMAAATTEVWQAMRRSAREGLPGIRLPPLLLDGPPGIGKSHWARRLGQLIGTPVTVIEATGEQASFGVVGSQRGWSSSHPGRLLQTVLQHLIANPVIVVDEVEKAGRATSGKGHTFGLAEALLPLLEPMSARRWSCPFYQVRFDMSWVAWVLTSNDLRRLPEPLLSRCTIVRVEELSIRDLGKFAENAGRARGLSDDSIMAIIDALEATSAVASARPNLRTISRMLDRAAHLENKPMVM